MEVCITEELNERILENALALRERAIHQTPGRAAISPDKQLVAAGIHDETLVWRIEDGELVTVMKTEPGSLVCLEFSPDGRLLMRGCPSIYPDRHLVQL